MKVNGGGKSRRRRDPDRIQRLLDGLAGLYPQATCELDFTNAFELLVATILSAQCTDRRVNLVTPQLFRRYPNPRALANARISELESIIRSTGFFRMKARNLQACGKALVRDHASQVPRTMEELITLPGVARKTANVVLGTAYGIASGVVVDTHVRRLSQRLGLTDKDDPGRIERDLVKVIPQASWIDFGHRLIWHGRRVCHARRPDCAHCLLAPICPSAQV